LKRKLSKLIWFTGLSGSGKSTLSNKIYGKLKRSKYKVLKIDGDIFRKKTKNVNSFSKKNIIYNNNMIILYIKTLIVNYDFILVSVISPLLVTRKKVKKLFGNKYFEVYVKCGIQELIKRDTKGLYEKAKEKKIKNLIGYNSKIKYEESNYKKIIINTKKLSILSSTNLILKKII
tara:strand:- start:143 stop:667 length:525 start_codon:yes stop_codon:yes gene_type:complete